MQLEKSKALLEEKVVKEKQKYSDLKGKYEELQSIKSCSGEVKLLKQKVAKEKQNYSDLLRKYEDLQNSQSFGTEAQIKLTKLESTLETVAISLEKVKVIKKYWGDKVCTTLLLVISCRQANHYSLLVTMLIICIYGIIAMICMV